MSLRLSIKIKRLLFLPQILKSKITHITTTFSYLVLLIVPIETPTIYDEINFFKSSLSTLKLKFIKDSIKKGAYYDQRYLVHVHIEILNKIFVTRRYYVPGSPSSICTTQLYYSHLRGPKYMNISRHQMNGHIKYLNGNRPKAFEDRRLLRSQPLQYILLKTSFSSMTFPRAHTMGNSQFLNARSLF